MYWSTRLINRVTFIPWLSLRAVFSTAPSGTLFCELASQVDRVNLLASLALHAVVLATLVGLWPLLPLPGWLAWPLAIGVAGLFLSGRRRAIIAVLAGVALTGLSSANDDWTGVAVGAACLVVWLVLTWESREAWRHWLAKPLDLPAVNVGSAKALRGHVRVLHLFLDTPRQQWCPSDRWQVLHIVDDACRWMIAGARRYNTPLAFQHVVVNPSRARYDGPIPAPNNDYAGMEPFQAIVADVLHGTDGSDGRAHAAQADDLAAADNACLLVHLAEHLGHVAYAVPERRRQHPATPIEYAVVGAWRNPAIFAHEILHLFGASDYRLSKFDDRAEVRHWDKLRESLLWRSIMFDGYHAIKQLVVDEQTAQCIGWM